MINGAIEYTIKEAAAAGSSSSLLNSALDSAKGNLGGAIGKDVAGGITDFMGKPGSLKYMGTAGALLAGDVLTSPSSQETIADTIYNVKKLTGNNGMSPTTKLLIGAGTAGALGLGGAAAYQIHKQNQENEDFDRINGYGEYYHKGPMSPTVANAAGVGGTYGYES